MSKTARNDWENNLFGKIYSDCSPTERVKYGVINILSTKNGVSCATSYGCAYLILSDHMRDRISFVHGDSSMKQPHLATYKNFYHIIYYLSDAIVSAMMEGAKKGSECQNVSYNYIEMQIHGDLLFNRDIKGIILPRSFEKNKATMEKIYTFCRRNGCIYSFY
jgi:hypothetical protein